MFAVLGDIVFDTLGSPEQLDACRSYGYREQRVLEDYPRLQWVGDGLEQISIELMFHTSFTDPQVQIALLLAAADDHQARALVMGNGTHRGYYVITKVKIAPLQSSAEGNLVSARASVSLQRWVSTSQFDPNLPPAPSTPPIALLVQTNSSDNQTRSVAHLNQSSSLVTTQVLSGPNNALNPGLSPILIRPGQLGVGTSSLAPADFTVMQITRSAAS